MQKVGILLSTIPDISGRKSGDFQIVATNHSIFSIKCYNTVHLWHISTPNEDNLEENKRLFTFKCHIMAKFSRYIIRTFLSWKFGNFFCNSVLMIKICQYMKDQYLAPDEWLASGDRWMINIWKYMND